jgi:YggT family protein
VRAIFFVLATLAEIYVLCLFARAILSWFPISYDSPAHRINSILVRVTEPLIAPVRRVLPPVRAGAVGIDLSFIVVLLVLQIIVIPLLYHLAR